MSVLETIRTKPAVGATVGVGLLLIASALILLEQRGRSSNVDALNQAFYSDDDGQTWFVGSASNLPPFDHNGKPADGATVCRASSGKLFVAHLQRYSDEQKSKIETARDPVEADHWRNAPMQMRKPGQTKWLSANSPSSSEVLSYRKALEPVCPDGSPTWTPVVPGDPDNGATR